MTAAVRALGAVGGPDLSQPRAVSRAGGRWAGGPVAAFVPVGLSVRALVGVKAGVDRARRVAERGGGAEGQTGRGPGPGRAVRSCLAGSSGGARGPRGHHPRPLPAATGRQGSPYGRRAGGSGLQGDPCSLGKLQLFVARWCPWQWGAGSARSAQSSGAAANCDSLLEICSGVGWQMTFEAQYVCESILDVH